MPDKHSILGPSSATRWLHCTPSVMLTKEMPDTTSSYAAEGTLAHHLAELKVRKKYIEPMGPRKFSNALKKLEKTELMDKDGSLRSPKDFWPEMMDATDAYLDYISQSFMAFEHEPHIAVEIELHFDTVAPGGFGTCDCLLIGGRKLHVVDFKYGRGVPVDAENNSQMMLYALGALEKYAALYDIQNIELTIFQPRADGETVKTWSTTREALLDWGVFTVKPLARSALAGEGEFHDGAWCQFCRAKNTCRQRNKTATALEDFAGINAPSKAEGGKFPMPPLLTDEEVGQALTLARAIKSWADDLEAYALPALLAGKTIPGWKAVEGTSRRRWEDTDTALTGLKAAGIEDAMLYKREPLTAPQVEKLLGKKKYEELAAQYVIKPPGKPALASESDKRQAITLNKTAAEDFDGMTKGE